MHLGLAIREREGRETEKPIRGDAMALPLPKLLCTWIIHTILTYLKMLMAVRV